MLSAGDTVSRIGDDEVVGVVLRYSVGPHDAKSQSNEDIVEVQVGESVLSVFAVACRKDIALPAVPSVVSVATTDNKLDRPIADIPRDGATMPAADGADVTPDWN